MKKYHSVEELTFFDANCMIGRYCHFQENSFYTKERLKEEMEYFGIKEGLVYHAVAKEYVPQVGNKMLLDELKKETSLHGCWALLPPYTKEMPPPEALVREMLAAGIKTVRVIPNERINPTILHDWEQPYLLFSLSQWSMGSTFSALQEHRIPLFIDFNTFFPYIDRTDWDMIYRICKDYPQLPVVLVHFGWRTNRKLYALFAQCDNFYMDISGYWLYRGIESICQEFGPEKILFGTNMPLYDPGCSIMLVTHANISEEQKKLVAGDNLRRLLSNVIF